MTLLWATLRKINIKNLKFSNVFTTYLFWLISTTSLCYSRLRLVIQILGIVGNLLSKQPLGLLELFFKMAKWPNLFLDMMKKLYMQLGLLISQKDWAKSIQAIASIVLYKQTQLTDPVMKLSKSKPVQKKQFFLFNSPILPRLVLFKSRTTVHFVSRRTLIRFINN